MASTINMSSSVPERTQSMPQIQHKEQYESLLSESDTQSLDREDLRAYSKSRQPWRTPFFYIPTILSVFLGMALVAVCSTNAARLDSILSQIREKVASIEATSALAPATQARPPRPTGEEFGHCGHSIKEAESLGCIFDPMSWAWQRPECYNAELINDFLGIFDWHFFPNNQTRPEEELSRETWVNGDYNGAWGPWAWHMYHCSYSWRKFDAAFHAQKPLDDDILDPLHTEHCSIDIILRDTDPTLHEPCLANPEACKITQMWMKFNKCGYY
ncbi:hypothetical protein F4811DRAFT_513873 [Daldinia bambusicola]|nr:hypothetical protein F4811DRAFT_513873 [Daldinia bambusicola]